MGRKIEMKIILTKKQKIPLIVEKNIKKLLKIIPLNEFKEIYINFVGLDEIKKINSKVFKKKKVTDIITITYDLIPQYKVGEIFICVDVAKKNAKKFSLSCETELFILLIHGFLHLKGYNDNSQSEFKKMNITTLKKLKKLL